MLLKKNHLSFESINNDAVEVLKISTSIKLTINH